MKYQFNDGGRAAAGFKGETRDCVTRAIAIAAELPYQAIYDRINEMAKPDDGRPDGARVGVQKSTRRELLAEMGWKWTPTMGIGTGCRVHLKEGELPMGRLIVSVSRHMVAVIDGVIHDTHDCSRNGTRCVYGYYTTAAAPISPT